MQPRTLNMFRQGLITLGVYEYNEVKVNESLAMYVRVMLRVKG